MQGVTERLEDRIAARMSGLSPQRRLAAEYAARRPEEVATRSLRHVAASAGLSPPTFSRLARALGFEGYEEMRDLCRAEVSAPRISFANRAEAMQRTDLGGFVESQAKAAMATLAAAFETLDPARLEAAADRLASARRVVLAGDRSSRPFADYMAYMTGMAFDDWTMLDTGGNAASVLSGIGPEDVLVAISMPPCARGTVAAARLARDAGAGVIGITDSHGSPLAGIADTVLLVRTDSPQFFSSYVATVALIETLTGLVVARAGAPARDRIARVEAANRALGAYWED